MGSQLMAPLTILINSAVMYTLLSKADEELIKTNT